MNRRDFILKCFRLLSFLVGIRVLDVPEVLCADKIDDGHRSTTFPKVPIGGHFVGEKLVYEMTFMMLFNAARLVIELLPHEKKKHYLASFHAETKGVVGWIVGYRKYHFRTLLEEIDGGKRFLPHRFHTSKIIKKKTLDRTYDFDYEKKRLHINYSKNGATLKSFAVPFFPKKYFNDILSLFYNLRYNSFWPIIRERRYEFLGLPKNNRDKKEILYTIEVFSQENEKQTRKDFGWKQPGYALKVKIDKEILTTKEGIIWVLLDQNMIPINGILQDAVGFGDVVGQLDRGTSG